LLRSVLLNALALAVVLSLSHALLKWVSQQPHAGFADLVARQWLPIGAALALYGGVFLWYLHALRVFDMAVLFPAYTGLTLVLVALAGVLLFGETLGARQLGGIALIAGGVFLLGK
jgi:multidrug transporter EmrE-like cation transporter